MRLGLVLLVLCVVPMAAQAPMVLPTGSAPTAKQAGPALTDLEACHVDVALQNETIVALKIQLADLQKRYDILQLQADRANRTPPPKEGFTWDWTRDPQTGQPKGYVKTETEAKP